MEGIRELTHKEKGLAITLAMKVECGEVPVQYVLNLFNNDKQTAESIVAFWLTFNNITKRALDIVLSEKFREHIENCWKYEAINYPDIEQ